MCNSDIPQEMICNDRPVDPVFEPDENLYSRFDKKHLMQDGYIDGQVFRFPDCSVNRGKGSQPEWVLIPDWPAWGIIRFEVQDVPDELQIENSAVYTFPVAHVPLAKNYFHSEIQTHKDGHHSRDMSIGSTIKKLYRQILTDTINRKREISIYRLPSS